METMKGPNEDTKRYFVDTGGAWMLDALFNEELAPLEPRVLEYLSLFINAYCEPGAEFFGVFPGGYRESSVLPKFFRKMVGEDEDRYKFVNSSKLVIGVDVLQEQFERFKRHLYFYGEHYAKLIRFANHRDVRDGFYTQTGDQSKIPGVPDSIFSFITNTRKAELCATGKTNDVDSIIQAFAIYSRGMVYATTAEEHDATLITTPFRWSSAGPPRKPQVVSGYAQMIGGIAAAAIDRNHIKSEVELYSRLQELRQSVQEYLPKLKKVEQDFKQANTDSQKDALRKKLETIVRQLVAGWTDGKLEPQAEGNVHKLVAALAGVIAYLATGSAYISGATGLISLPLLHLFTSDLVVDRIAGESRFLRKWVCYDSEAWMPQSCGFCGAPISVTHTYGMGRSCVVCNNEYASPAGLDQCEVDR